MMNNKPIIGITRNSDRAEPPDASYPFYAQSVEAAGGSPQAVFFREALEEVGAVLDGVDGLLFTGGGDLNPATYGQQWHPAAQRIDPQRERWELALLAEAERRRLPVLGICLGCQLLNVHRGGSLIQFLPDETRQDALEHRKMGDVILRHDVTIEPDSILARAVGKTQISVNTYHKQAVYVAGRGLRIVARAGDAVVEAVEDASLPLFLGVQWHPERISGEMEHLALFRMLIAAVESSRRPALLPCRRS